MEKPFGGSFKYREPLNEAFMITSKDFQFADKHTTALTCSQCFTMFECNILVGISGSLSGGTSFRRSKES